MPDSFTPPFEGPQSYDDRALDSLLSGSASDIPGSLRPVADALNALRAAPSARELRGEAAARAQFRALRDEALPGAEGSRTLEMPVVPAQRRRGVPVRAARRWSFRLRLAGLTAVAAVFVLAVALTYTGNLPGRLQRIAHDTISAPPARTDAGSATPGMQATSASPLAPSANSPAGSAPASEAPAPSAGAQGRARQALCDQFWSDMEHSRPGRLSWQTPRYTQLVTAAGGAQKVFGYCFPVWDPKLAPQYQQLPSYPPYFPKKWGAEGGDNNSQGQNQGQSQNQGGQQPDPGRQPRPGDTGGPQPANTGGAGNQNQDSGSQN